MEQERSLEDTEMHSNRHRGNDWDSTGGRKEEEGRAPLTGDETLSESQEESVRTQLVQDACRAGPRPRASLRLALVRAGSKVKAKPGGLITQTAILLSKRATAVYNTIGNDVRTKFTVPQSKKDIVVSIR